MKDHTKRKHKTTSESETQTNANSKTSAFQQTDDEKTEFENYSCFYCENEITSDVNLIEHRLTCQGAAETPSLFSFQIRSRAIPYKCVICGLVTSTREEMVNHKKSVHDD